MGFIEVGGKKIALDDEIFKAVLEQENQRQLERAKKRRAESFERAKNLEPYWYIDDTGIPRENVDTNSEIDTRRYHCGNYFRNEGLIFQWAANEVLLRLLRETTFIEGYDGTSEERWVMYKDEEDIFRVKPISAYEIPFGAIAFNSKEDAEKGVEFMKRVIKPSNKNLKIS